MNCINKFNWHAHCIYLSGAYLQSTSQPATSLSVAGKFFVLPYAKQVVIHSAYYWLPPRNLSRYNQSSSFE